MRTVPFAPAILAAAFITAACFTAACFTAGCSSYPDEEPATLVVGLSHVCEGRFEYFNESLAVNTRIALALHTDNGVVMTRQGPVQLRLISMAVSGKSGSPRQMFFETIHNYDAGIVIGNACSVTATNMARAADELRVPYMAPVAAAPSVLKGREFAFGTSPSMADKARAFASFIETDLKARRIAILARRGSLQLDIYADAFGAYFAEHEGDLVAVEAYDQPGELPARVAALAELKPDVILYCPVAPHVFTIAGELEKLGARIPLVATQSKMLFDYASFLPQPDIPLYSLSFWNPEQETPESRVYVEAFEAGTGRLPTEDDAYVYDTAQRLIEAVQKADDRRPESIRRALAAANTLSGAVGVYTFQPDASLERIWRLVLTGGQLGIGLPAGSHTVAGAPSR